MKLKKTLIYKIWLLFVAAFTHSLTNQWIHEDESEEYYLSFSEEK